ncbi:MAG: ATPase [Bacteroidetes bacterium]|nr:MAG: ATPase [Bacteroidota bacterium]
MAFYLKKAVLDRGKSIRHAEIDLLSGLNVVIGKNGSGKTNFLNFLTTAISSNFHVLEGEFSELIFANNGVDFSMRVTKEIAIHSSGVASFPSPIVNKELIINGKSFNPQRNSEYLDVLEQNKSVFFDNYIQYGVPEKFLLFKDPYSFSIDYQEKQSTNLSNLYSSIPNQLSSATIILNSLFISLTKLTERPKEKNISEILNKIQSKFITPIESNLRLITNIEEVRISPNLNFYYEHNAKLIINNLFFEYKIDDNWLPYSSLSDGTRRVLYLVFETQIMSFVKAGVQEMMIDEIPNKDIFKPEGILIFIEEPELGLHPHQLHKLMEFLKEQSESKQIILTTHSPQVLDILGPDELERIIICEYDHEKGTQLRHMTEEEMERARNYMKKMYLSDFWRFTDFNEK